MAIRAITDIVKSKLPFLVVADDPTIESYRIEMCYFLQGQTGKEDIDVEAEANYKALENMLFADMVSYNMGKDQVAKVTGGVAGAAPTSKILKKAKADVVETEFTIVKSSDGANWSIPTDVWFTSLLKDICDKSRTLGIENPMCFDPSTITPNVPYIIGSDFPKNAPDPYDLLNGTIQG